MLPTAHEIARRPSGPLPTSHPAVGYQDLSNVTEFHDPNPSPNVASIRAAG